jgi:hypothetical protein
MNLYQHEAQASEFRRTVHSLALRAGILAAFAERTGFATIYSVENSRLEQAPRSSGSTTILKCRNCAELVPAYDSPCVAELCENLTHRLTDDQLMRPVTLVVQDGVSRNAEQVIERGGEVGLRAWGLGGVGGGVV